jgi:DNA polymerase-3 subunit alpha
MSYIPQFILRKHGKETVSYDLDDMQEYLEETYGITVYQEQVMLLSQKLAGFSKGDADVLRKAMGKKQIAVLNKMKVQFIEGATGKGHAKDKLEKIWKDWEAFAQYAFNKSHSTCYAFVAYQTAYLKAHYPSEYMAAVLNHAGSIDKITFFMEECKRMGLKVLGPDVNESKLKFSVNQKGQIRFGLAAVKGVGEAAVESLITERAANGHFASIFDFVKRVSLRAVNKKSIEGMAIAGAFDEFIQSNRSVFFHSDMPGKPTFLDTIVKYGQSVQEGKEHAATSLFGDSSDEISIPEPIIPKAEPWHVLVMLEKEKEVVGIYLSGHPLDDYRQEMKNFNFIPMAELENLEQFRNKSECKSGGIITSVGHRFTKTGKPFGSFVIEDFSGSREFVLFSEKYLKLKHYLDPGNIIYINWKPNKSFRNPDGLETDILTMGVLADLKDKYTQITMQVNETEMSEVFVNALVDIFLRHPGKCSIKMILAANDATLSVQTKANLKVDTNPDFLKELEALIGDRYRLN